MILIDTHVWIWWVSGDANLPAVDLQTLVTSQGQGIGVSAISCWEVAKLVENGRLTLTLPVGRWLGSALAIEGIQLLPLTPEIAVESTQLSGGWIPEKC